jgi:hypothetical protein
MLPKTAALDTDLPECNVKGGIFVHLIIGISPLGTFEGKSI